jgi:hypothetical protein
MDKRLVGALPDGRIFVTTLSSLTSKVGVDPDTISSDDDESYQAYVLEKTMFELSRPWLANSDLSGDALNQWRRSVHFDEFLGNTPISCRECTTGEVPAQRHFREAWEDTGLIIDVNMPNARGIHMDHIRVARNAELAAKDITFMRAVEAGDTDAQATIATEKQVLRDIPQTFDLTTETPTQLLAKWPAELPARE